MSGRIEQIEGPSWGETLHAWVTTVDHKRIGLLYILYALLFLVIAGVEALVMRIQLLHSHNDFVSPQLFNQMFTMHGTTMIFFVAMPILFGFGNYLVPLMIGARDMAFPRLNAFSFWLSALGGVLLYFSFVGGSGLYGAGTAPDVGWWAYAPLTARAFSPGASPDYWTIAVLVSGFGSFARAINLIAKRATWPSVRPIRSCQTRIWPSQPAPEPMPIVGTRTASVIRSATGAGMASSTRAEQPARSTANASSQSRRACSTVRP
jgi:hypothetical protein